VRTESQKLTYAFPFHFPSPQGTATTQQEKREKGYTVRQSSLARVLSQHAATKRKGGQHFYLCKRLSCFLPLLDELGYTFSLISVAGASNCSPVLKQCPMCSTNPTWARFIALRLFSAIFWLTLRHSGGPDWRCCLNESGRASSLRSYHRSGCQYLSTHADGPAFPAGCCRHSHRPDFSSSRCFGIR